MAKKLQLKNYTSEITASRSIAKIEDCLVSAGASDISKKYTDGVCSAITFRMVVTGNIPVFFKLPAKVDSCFAVFWKEVSRPRNDTKQRIREQAERTAWKIVCDWVEIQLSMIQLEQAEPLQVFLPYVYDPAREETFYEKIVGSGMKLLSN